MPSAAGPSASLLEAFKLLALLVIWLLDLEMTFRWRGALWFLVWSKNAQYATWSSKEEPELHGGGSGAERGTISALWLPLKGRSSFVRRPMSQVNWWKKNRKTLCLTGVSRNPRLPHFFLSNLFGLVVVANWVFVPAPQPFWFGITQNLAVVLTNSYAVWMCRPRAA